MSTFYVGQSDYLTQLNILADSILGAGISLTSLTTNTATAANTSTLAYNNTTGVFTYTPLSAYNKTETYTKTEVNAAIQAVVGAAPAALDTLAEIAAELTSTGSTAGALTTQLSLKAPIASPTFTGTVSGVTKAMVGLGNVDNTSDANKPVSTAATAAILASSTTVNPLISTNSTESTSTSTGALIISGGAGIAGNLNLGGNVTLGGYGSIKALMETVTVVATAPTAITHFDVITQSVLYHTASTTANFTLNLRGNATATLNSIMAVGQALSVAVLVTNGATAYYPNVISIDGVTITPKWPSGTVVNAGTVSSIDSYSITVIKTASSTYTVLVSRGKFA